MSLLNKIFIVVMIVCLLPVEGKAFFGIKARQEQKHLLADAREAYDKGQYEKAIELSQKLLLTNAPKRRIRRVYLVLGPSYKAQGDYAKALLVYNEALEFYPKDIEISLGLADIYLIGGLYDQAIAIYNSVLVMDPTNSKARLGLARGYADQGFYTRSIKYYKEYIDSDEASDIDILREYAGSLYDGKKYEDALKTIAKVEAFQKQPDAELTFLKAKVYKGLGLKKESFETMKQAYLIDIKDKNIAYTYALWLVYDGQYDESLAILDKLDKTGSQRLTLFIEFMAYRKTNSKKAKAALTELEAYRGEGFLDKVADRILETHYNVKPQ